MLSVLYRVAVLIPWFAMLWVVFETLTPTDDVPLSVGLSFLLYSVCTAWALADPPAFADLEDES